MEQLLCAFIIVIALASLPLYWWFRWTRTSRSRKSFNMDPRRIDAGYILTSMFLDDDVDDYRDGVASALFQLQVSDELLRDVYWREASIVMAELWLGVAGPSGGVNREWYEERVLSLRTSVGFLQWFAGHMLGVFCYRSFVQTLSTVHQHAESID